MTPAKTAAPAKNEPHRPQNHNQKVYDGSRVVVHPVQKGESLARIANIYQMKMWQPIWLYNSEVLSILGGKPEDLRPGVSIMIPRSQKGYMDMLKRLSHAKGDAQMTGDKLRYELEAQQYELEAHKVALDFVSDVATTLATLGAKAAISSKAAASSAAAKGQAKIAHQLSVNAITKDFADKFAKVRGEKLKTALAQHAKSQAFKPNLKGDLIKAGIGGASEHADKMAQTKTGNEDFAWFSTAFKTVVTSMAAREAWKAVGLGAKAVDVAGAALDYIKPSMVAEMMLLAATGETAADSQKNAQAMIKKSTAKAVENLETLIAKYKGEMKLLYG